MSSNSKSLSSKIRSLRAKNAAKKIQRGFRTRKRDLVVEDFMQNPRNPFLNYAVAAKSESRRVMPPGKIALFFAKLLNNHGQTARKVSGNLHNMTPLHKAKVELLNIVGTEEFIYFDGEILINGEEPTRRIDPRNFGPLRRVEEEDDNDIEGEMRYEFIFENVEIHVNVADGSDLQHRLHDVYDILKPLVPQRRLHGSRRR